MNKETTLEEAFTMAARCKKAIEIAGRVYVSFPFNPIDMADALVVLSAAAKDTANGVPRSEHTKLSRQMTALRARYVRLARKHGEEVKEDEDNE